MKSEANSQKYNVLLTGNGISMAAKRSGSWENIVTSEIAKRKQKFSYDDIKSLPANMQIVVASNNNVKDVMKSLAESMTSPLDKDASDFLREITDIPADAFLTTNYDYDLEQACGIKPSLYEFRKCRRWTRDVHKGTNAKKYNLYQYSSVGDEASPKNIWHIHGDICYKESMIMGHRYYGGLLSAIQNESHLFFSTRRPTLKLHRDYVPSSWIDYFLLGDIYIMGFGYYATETDLWWLLDTKKRESPETKVYYYVPEDGKRDKANELLLKAYDVTIVDNIPFDKATEDYQAYYKKCIKDIRKRMNKGKR